MKTTIAIATLLLASATASAQTEINPYIPSMQEGVTYMLPRTVLKFDVKVKVSRFTPGEYQKYAERYLRLKDTQAEASTTDTIEEVRMEPVAKPDTSKTFTLKLKDKTIAPMVRLSKDGILLGINADQPEPVLFGGYKTEKEGEALDTKQYLTEDILMAGSTAKAAELCAQEIYAIRESKNALNRGQADFMPTDGKQMEIMIANLTKQEQAFMQLFVGYTITETMSLRFYVDPSEEMSRQILMRFSKRRGLVDKDDLGGEPVYIDVKDLHTLPQAEPSEGEKRKKEIKLEGIQYNIPSKAKVEIYTASDKLLSAEVNLAQFGNVETLSSTLFNKRTDTKVLFVPETGAIKSVDGGI